MSLNGFLTTVKNWECPYRGTPILIFGELNMSIDLEEMKNWASGYLSDHLKFMSMDKISWYPDTLDYYIPFEIKYGPECFEDICGYIDTKKTLRDSNICEKIYTGMNDILIEECKYNNDMQDISGWNRQFGNLAGFTYRLMDQKCLF